MPRVASTSPTDMALNFLLSMKRTYIALKFGKRKVIDLDSPWSKGNQLFDWYYSLETHLIDTVQLRKEREPPLFHEYVTICLRGGARCFRVDRFPRDNNIPLVDRDDVLAHDTISPILSLDARSPHASDCLIDIKFKPNVEVDLKLLLNICQAISRHPDAKKYAVQYYGSSFHSQTLLMCLAHEYTIQTAPERPGPPNLSDQNQRAAQPSIVPMHPPDTLHQNYPNTSFITHEDQCLTCWKLALFSRVTHQGGRVGSVENVSGLFWDRVERVASEFILLLDMSEDSRNELWFLCPRVHWMEVCHKLTYQVIRHTWDSRLDLFKQNLVSLAGMPPGSAISGSNIGCLPIAIQNITSDLKDPNSPMTKFFEERINKPETKEKLKARARIVQEVCRKSHTFHMALKKYYSAINMRMDIKFGFRFYQRPDTNMLINALSAITRKPSYKCDLAGHSLADHSSGEQDVPEHNLAEHLQIPKDFMLQSHPKYASRPKEHELEQLQEYLVLLLYARGVRVASYKAQLGCDATTVVREIANTRKDIWEVILKESLSASP